MTYDIDDVRQYVEGWLCSGSKSCSLEMNEILAMLNNALVNIEDGDDGLDAYIERQKYYENIRR
jgi:hypothetical protein